MLVSSRLLHRCPLQGIHNTLRVPARRVHSAQSLQRAHTYPTIPSIQAQSFRRLFATAKTGTPKQPASKAASESAQRTGTKSAQTPATQAFTGTKGSAPPTPESAKAGYPVRLLIYHAGTGRTVFLSCIKLTSIFLFLFTATLISPAYYYSPFEPTYMAPLSLFAGAIPMLLMVFSTAPFVTYVHLKLPGWARVSQARLLRYVQNLPGSAELDFTTVRWIWPRVTRLQANELYIHRTKAGTMTLRREIPAEVWRERKWYHWRPLKRFYVAGKSGKTFDKAPIWQYVIKCVVNGFPKQQTGRAPV